MADAKKEAAIKRLLFGGSSGYKKKTATPTPTPAPAPTSAAAPASPALPTAAATAIAASTVSDSKSAPAATATPAVATPAAALFAVRTADSLRPLSAYRVSPPETPNLYYVPDWLSASEESAICDAVESAPPERWTFLRRRSLQNYGGTPLPDGMTEEPLPVWLQGVTRRLVGENLFPVNSDSYGRAPNHVLVNRYAVGQGIMPHRDGPLYVPYVCIVSCAGSVVLSFYESLADERDRKPIASLYCAPRSLLAFERTFYHTYFHSIEETDVDVITDKVLNRAAHGLAVGDRVPRTTTRVSLTIRVAPTVDDIKQQRKTGDKPQTTESATQPAAATVTPSAGASAIAATAVAATPTVSAAS